MRKIIICTFFLIAFTSPTHVWAQAKKIDTTAMYGDAGYRVTCNNKKDADNLVSVSPKGFKNTTRDVSFAINGRLTGVIVDDLNDDGFPDLLIIYFNGPNHAIGNISAISSVDNTSIKQVYFPDIYSDPKLREGYKGNDEFNILAGSLMRSFPIYKSDTTIPTGVTQVIQYKIIPVENGNLTLKVLRSYQK